MALLLHFELYPTVKIFFFFLFFIFTYMAHFFKPVISNLKMCLMCIFTKYLIDVNLSVDYQLFLLLDVTLAI